MEITVHVAAIDDPHGFELVTIAAGSEQQLLDMLRGNYAAGDEVSDSDLIQWICDQGLEVHIDRHEIHINV